MLGLGRTLSEFIEIGNARSGRSQCLPEALCHGDEGKETDQEHPTHVRACRDESKAQNTGHDTGSIDPMCVAQSDDGEHGEEDDDAAAQERRCLHRDVVT